VRISVIGLGKLGSPLAAVLASKGHEVVGVDLNPEYVSSINAGRSPVQEPGLQELVEAHSSRLRATQDIAAATAASEVTFIIVPTPSGADGTFSNKLVLAAIAVIGRALRSSSSYHLVVVTSTVMPGATGGVIRDELERSSGRKVGTALGLCYSPEFIALGSVIAGLLRPDFVLIGESDRRAGDLLQGIYEGICENRPTMCRMNFVNAELTKLAVNTFVTTKVSYANMIAGICDRLPGADADVVVRAVGQDSRIGSKYLQAAMGYGGPCFPRDNIAFASLARSLGSRADIAEATDSMNRYQLDRMVERVQERLSAGTVGILGLAYKPNTAVIDESPSIALVCLLADLGYQVFGHDPLALGAAASVLGPKMSPAQTVAECAKRADLLIIATPWPDYRDLPAECLARQAGPMPVIDCWRILRAEVYCDVAEIIYLGAGGEWTSTSSMDASLQRVAGDAAG
jgi:UDPglucose 6-dehydrogenase